MTDEQVRKPAVAFASASRDMLVTPPRPIHQSWLDLRTAAPRKLLTLVD